MECVSNGFEYFQPQPIQTSILRTFKREYTPISALQHGSPIEFHVPGTAQLYLDLANSFIELKAKIVDAENKDTTADTKAVPCNNVLHSLFAGIEVELNGKTISDANALYPYRAYFETLFNFNKEAQDNMLDIQGWARDTAGKMAVYDSTGAAATNEGAKKRMKRFLEGRTVQMIGRPHVDIFHQGLYLPSNVSLKMKFNISKDNFVISQPIGAAVAYKMKILEMKLVIKTIEVSPSLALAHEQMLVKSNMRFPLRRVTLKHLSIPAGQTTISHDNIVLGEIPERIILALVNDSDLVGGNQTNPFNFQHFSVNQLAMYVNGELVPNKKYTPNFATGEYIREFVGMYEGLNKYLKPQTFDLSLAEYGNGYTIYVFDLSPDSLSADCHAVPRKGAVRLDLQFSAAPAGSIAALLYAEYDSMIEIDKFRNVITPNF